MSPLFSRARGGVLLLAWVCLPSLAQGAQGGAASDGHRVNRSRPVPSRSHVMPPAKPIDVGRLPKDREAAQVQLAEQQLSQGRPTLATTTLGTSRGGAAALVRARIAAASRRWPEVEAALDSISDGALTELVHFERGQLALACDRASQAALFLAPLVDHKKTTAQKAAVPLARALLASNPRQLLARLPSLLQIYAGEAGGTGGGAAVRSLLMELGAQAHDAQGDPQAARRLRITRYLTEPNARGAPTVPPEGAAISAEMALSRIELLVAAHSSTAARAALAQFDAQYPAQSLTLSLSCRRGFAAGMASRKLHRYAEAEAAMATVKAQCSHDEDLRRRAAFTEAKVVNIQDGARALPLIEAFAALYPAHTMTDDVLFWAGDSHQRRGHRELAEGYYERILRLPEPDDQCEEAAWRLAWLAYSEGKLPLAFSRLEAALKGRCTTSQDGVARAHYWMGRITEAQHQPARAVASYRRAMVQRHMGFYGQQAASRLLPLLSVDQRRSLLREWAAPGSLLSGRDSGQGPGLCPGQLVDHVPFVQGLGYLRRGLQQDAARAFALVRLPPAQPGPSLQRALQRCGPVQSALLLVQLRMAAGDHAGGLGQLVHHFSPGTWHKSGPWAKSLWQAGYAQAFRPLLQAAEREHGVPPWLLQALAREESRFDPQAVSWAEAYGLTQLTLAAARHAGSKIKPKMAPAHMNDLFEPTSNARLGGALLGQLGTRYQQFWPLALAGYNGGQRAADAWWAKFAGEDFARMAEEMTVRETRTYVQRVMETYGIYRWLYAGASPGAVMPAKVPVAKRR